MTYLGTLYRENPAAARAEILRVLRRQEGSVTLAARDIGLSRRNFIRYLHMESLWEELEAIRGNAPPSKGAPLHPALQRARGVLARHEGT